VQYAMAHSLSHAAPPAPTGSAVPTLSLSLIKFV